IAPPRQDLYVFIRLETRAPARAYNHELWFNSGYTIWTLIREKLGAVLDKIQ
ncbi:hypothetical protein DER46DRAFT_514026, partial [Fusarium sp. MPI-SDFR-AT-0072]